MPATRAASVVTGVLILCANQAPTSIASSVRVPAAASNQVSSSWRMRRTTSCPLTSATSSVPSASIRRRW